MNRHSKLIDHWRPPELGTVIMEWRIQQAHYTMMAGQPSQQEIYD